LAANRRAAGLHIFHQLTDALLHKWSRLSYMDTVSWLRASLKSEDSKVQTHYLDSLQGCGQGLELVLGDRFFKIMASIVSQLREDSNTDAEIEFFINSLRWRYRGRDHISVSKLKLFETLHKGGKLYIYWGKAIKSDFDEKTD
jgi:hypothetical protein